MNFVLTDKVATNTELGSCKLIAVFEPPLGGYVWRKQWQKQLHH